MNSLPYAHIRIPCNEVRKNAFNETLGYVRNASSSSFFIPPDLSLQLLNDIKQVITVGVHLFVYVVVDLHGMFRTLVNIFDAAFSKKVANV